MPSARLPLVCALILLAGCDGGTLSRVVGAAPPVIAEPIIDVDSGDATDPHRVVFGEVFAGEQAFAYITVTNRGSDPLQVRALELDAAGFEVESAGDAVLAPDSSTVVQLSYSPSRDESVARTLRVHSNDRVDPIVPVTLHAEGLAPAVQIEPPSYDFGRPSIGCVSHLDVTVANVGRAPLTLHELVFDDLVGTAELTAVHSVAPGTALEPGESVDVRITHTPTDTAPDAGRLTVFTDAPNAPAVASEVTGAADPGEFVRDGYLQDGDNATDILFAIDGSCSMGEEHAFLAQNIASFLATLDALEINYHLGFVNSDVGTGGGLLGNPNYITPNTPDPVGAALANPALTLDSSGVEQPFHNAWLALSSPNTDPGGPNDGFLRHEAGLRVIHVSDEPEQSATAPGSLGTGADYVAAFQSLKPNPDHVVISSISGELTGCSGVGGNATPGVDFVEAAVLTGGTTASVCDPNWAATLSVLAQESVSVADTFELSQIPLQGAVDVFRNGVPIYVGWHYDSALNAVVFDEDHVPENGDLVEFEYAIAGACGD